MDKNTQDSPDLDELQQSIKESAEQARVTIDVKEHDEDTQEASSSEDESATDELDLEVTHDDEENIEPAEDTSEPNEEIDSEAEEESGTDETAEEPETAEEMPKKAGPEGPYQPKIPEGSDEESPEMPEEEDLLAEEAQEDDQSKTDETSDDINKNVDQMLSVESAAAQAAASAASTSAVSESDKSFKAKIKRFFSAWWRNKKARYGTIFALILLLVLGAFIPVTRYAALNLAGVRVSSSLIVVDSKTGLPLENIPVSLAGIETRSGDDGIVSFKGLKLGSNKLVVNKLGYASYEKDLTLGFGSNPLGEQPMIATGAQYSFVLTDWLSENTLQDADAKSGEDVAKADAQGRIVLTVGDLSNDAEVSIMAPGYRVETFKLNDLDAEVRAVAMVPEKKHVFVSNRNGEYDLYKVDVDGKNEEILLKASGKEREIPYVLPHQNKDKAAFVSSRDADMNDGGFVLDGLFIIDVASGETKKVMRSEQLQVIGWVGNKLVYVAVAEGVSAGNPQRSKAFSYDTESGERIELASSNYFNDVVLVDDLVYYSVSSYSVPESQAKLFSIGADGENKLTVVDAQVWSIVRSDFKTLLFNAVDRQWFEQEVGSSPRKLDTEPSNSTNRIYNVSPSGEEAVWVDVRDGKGTLLRYNTATGEDEVVIAQAGLTDPVYWLNDSYVVYRVDTTGETADFVMNMEGGDPQKISDVVGNRSRYFY
jgi:hypothetical protein